MLEFVPAVLMGSPVMGLNGAKSPLTISRSMLPTADRFHNRLFLATSRPSRSCSRVRFAER